MTSFARLQSAHDVPPHSVADGLGFVVTVQKQVGVGFRPDEQIRKGSIRPAVASEKPLEPAASLQVKGGAIEQRHQGINRLID